MNVEIKARLSDRDALLRRLEPMAEKHTVLRQRDIYFRVAHGRLKLRRSTVCGDGAPGEESCSLFFYDRPDAPGPKLSRYQRLQLDGETAALTLQDMLDRSLGTLGTVCKERHLFLVGCTRVHVDAVQGLGDFLELEVGRRCLERASNRHHKVLPLGDTVSPSSQVVLGEGQDPEEGRATAEALMAVLGVQPDSLESGSYLDLLAPQ